MKLWKLLKQKTCAETRKNSWRSNVPKSDANKRSANETAKPVKRDADAIDAKMNAMHANETANETAITNASNETRIMETVDSILTTVFQTAW